MDLFLLRRRPALTATALYALAALATTWPLVRGLGRDLPWDLGDPVLNCWILGWTAERMRRLLSGDVSALQQFWDANIFFPAPHALAYSEHLIAQATQILPIYILTGNLVLCYDLLFLSTFVLSGLGAFLFVRALTGRNLPAFVAGLVFGFTPYRVEQFSHLQVLSAQWMPFALFGLRRFFETRRPLPLAGAALALLAQNLSCGYFLVYFPPFAAAYALYELTARGLWRDRRVITLLALTGLSVAIATTPFLLPYFEVRGQGALVRPRWEVEQFSADVWSYFTASESLRFWGGWLQAFPKSEGSLFPGAIPLILTAVGLGPVLWAAGAVGEASARLTPRRVLAILALIATALHVLAVVLILAGVGGAISAWLPGLGLRSLRHALSAAFLSFVALLALSPRARAFVRALGGSPVVFYAAMALIAIWLSLGPTVRTQGEPLTASLYGLLYDHVPGFDGLRVPARFAMLVMLFLAVSAGYGAVQVERRWRMGHWWLVAAIIVFLLESTAAPIVLNDVWSETGLRPPPPRVLTGDEAPAIYRVVAALPPDAVLAEFPFGSEPYEVRYMFESTEHWRRLLNGLSGALPPAYVRLRAALSAVLFEPDRAWTALHASGATHAIVHEAAWWQRRKGERVSAWLEAHGARRLARIEGDVLFALPQ